MMKKYVFVLFFPLFSFLAHPAWGHGPHEHGVARLNVALEGQRLSIELDSPLANLLSFEHAPRTDPQRNEVRALAARLRGAETLFVPSGAASCRLASVALESENLPGNLLDSAASSSARPDDAQAGDEKADAAEHADLEGAFVFQCDKPEALARIDVRLFGAFPALREIEVQFVAHGRQGAIALTPKSSVLEW